MSREERNNGRRYSLKNVITRRSLGVVCECGWEVKFGYGVAVTLAIFEAKRFFMLALEMLAEWQLIRFAGGLHPVVLTSVDISLGLPTALTAVYTIRKHKVPRCYTKTKKLLKCLLLIIMTCAVLNVATLASIGYHISVKQKTVVKVFNASMRLYVSAASYKYTIDEIQFVFQCCGHTSYADWFLFDWQKVDYASRDEIMYHNEVSDERYRGLGVPFSCCSLHSMSPCMHTAIITEADARTINANGCAQIISPVLLRIVVIAYVMTCTLIVTQILLAFLIARMIERLLPENCLPSCRTSKSPKESTTVLVSPRSINSKFSVCTTGDVMNSLKKKRRSLKFRTKHAGRSSSRKRMYVNDDTGSSSSTCNSPLPNISMDVRSVHEAASINPSTHEEHKISTKRLHKKR